MEEEHERIDPLLAAVDAAFPGGSPWGSRGEGSPPGAGRSPGVLPPGEHSDRLADIIDLLTSTLTGHLAHEERDGLPLIGVALTAAEWRGAGRKIARKNGLAAGSEMFAWILDDADGEHAAAALPAPLRLLYRAIWKPRFDKTPRW